MIKTLLISGFRGFGAEQTIPFASPKENMPGSGLTIITGANNSGKTTIIEAIRAFNGNAPSFSEGRRNRDTKGIVTLRLTDDADNEYVIETHGGSEATKSAGKIPNCYVLQSRRFTPYEFGKQYLSKDSYVNLYQTLDSQRKSELTSFSVRLFEIYQKHRKKFNELLNRVLGYDFEWTIDQRDNGQYYLKCVNGGLSHSSEGLGDGIWSVFTICAAFCDSKDGDTIVIDEPELSLHPALQRRLMELFVERAATRQIIISTHSPYFVNWSAIKNGAELIRVHKPGANSLCGYIKDATRDLIKNRIDNINNPHTFGLEANEAFFLEDGIILVEGQEDVVIFRKIAEQLDMPFHGDFFGWGVNGAANMKFFLQLFSDLGYERVTAIFDGDKEQEMNDCKNEFPSYGFSILPTDDIRDKEARQEKYPKKGIADKRGTLHEEYKGYVKDLIEKVNQDLKRPTSPES